MAEIEPTRYMGPHGFTGCTQCGGSCFGKHCLSPTCQYIERAAFNRFERPPVYTDPNTCIKFPVTCKTVGDMMYHYGEFVSPMYLPLSNQCVSKTKNSEFQMSRINYAHL